MASATESLPHNGLCPGFEYNDGGLLGQHTAGRRELNRFQRCGIRTSGFIIFSVSVVVGFFVLGPFIVNHVLADSCLTKHDAGSIPAKAFMPVAVKPVHRMVNLRASTVRLMSSGGESSGADVLSGGDALLMATMDALDKNELAVALNLVQQANNAYIEAGGPTNEQSEILFQLWSSIDAALKAALGWTTTTLHPSDQKRIRLQDEARALGDKKLMASISAFSNKTDAERFRKTYALLQEARDGFARADIDVAIEREVVVSNLIQSVRVEEERMQRMAKLVRMKKLLKLAKDKRKAAALEAAAERERAKQQAAEAPPSPENLADSQLETWLEEGVSQADEEIHDLEQKIEGLENSL